MTSRVAKNTLYFTAASVGQKAIAFVYFLFLARVMMPDLTGQYFLALSITTIFSVVAEFGITSVVIREIAKTPQRARGLIATALGLKVPLALLAVAGAIAAGWLLDYEPAVQRLIALASLVLLVDTLQVFFYGVLRGFQALKYEAVGVFAGMFSTALFGGLVLWLSPSLPLLILALLLGSAVNLVAAAGNVVRRLGWRALLPAWDAPRARWIMRTALPFALAAIFVKVYSYVDSIFISKFLDTTAVGLYAIAYKFTYAFQFLPLAFVAALYPGMSEVAGRDEAAMERLLVQSTWYMAILSAPIVFGLWAVAPEAVALAGDGYTDAAIVLQTLVFVLIPIFLDFPIGSLLNAAGYQSVKTGIMGATMVVNIVLNLMLIPLFGIVGAAYAALASFTFMLVAGLFFVPRLLPRFSLFAILKTIVPIYASGLMMLAVVVALKPFLGWVAVIPVGALVYVAGLLATKSLRAADIAYLRKL